MLRRDIRHGSVEHGAQQLQVTFVCCQRQLNQLVDHLLVGEHQHGNDAAFGRQNQVIPLDGQAAAAGGSGDCRKVRGLRYKPGHLLHHFVHTLHFFFNGVVDGFGFVDTQAVVHHQFIHIQPVACGGGNPSGAGMGLLQITHGGQLRHFVADGCGGVLHVGKLGDGLGAHRLGGADIKVDYGSQDLLFPFAQFHLISSSLSTHSL